MRCTLRDNEVFLCLTLSRLFRFQKPRGSWGAADQGAIFFIARCRVHRGYIKLWRKIFDSGIQKEHTTFMLWIWILCNVTRQPLKYIARGQQINLEPGELIIGRKRLSEELMISEQSIRTCLEHLKSWGNLTIRSTNRFSILKVMNWELYQESVTQINQQVNQEVTSNQPASNHKTRSKEVKNVKNKDREGVPGNGIPEWIPKETWEQFKEFRLRKKAPLTQLAIKKTISELEKLKADGYDPQSVLEQSVYRGWTGVFPIKGQKQDDCPGFDWSKP